MVRRRALLTVGGLVVLLLAVYVPATAVLDPSASPILGVGGARAPTSTIAPLTEFSRQVVTINYTSDGTAGQSGVFWTELWYQTPGQPWKQYMPPWNPSGQWSGAPLNSPPYSSVGTILFDTFHTGGEAAYNFTLGEERAMAVRDYIAKKHAVALSRLNVISYGEEKPVTDNKTREDRAQNRRVVIRILE